MNSFSLLFAYAEPNLEFGHQNRLPWSRIDADMKWFASKTRDSVLIMGRYTYESLPVLKNRHILVVSSQHFSSLQNALQEAWTKYPSKSVSVIGGPRLLEEALEHKGCAQVYATRVYLKKDVQLKADVYLKESFLTRLSLEFDCIDVKEINMDNHPQATKIEICTFSHTMASHLPRPL